MAPRRAAALALVLLSLVSCSSPEGPPSVTRPPNEFVGGTREIQAHYSPADGRLELLSFDSDKNGTIDTWSFMDASTVVRIEIDRDEDGKIERWEYYAPGQVMEKVGWSRAGDGRVDAWMYPAADGSITKIEYAERPAGAALPVSLPPPGGAPAPGRSLAAPVSSAPLPATSSGAASSPPTAAAQAAAASAARPGPIGAPPVFDPAEIRRGDPVPRPPDSSPASTRIVRTEFYEGGALARVEEDTDADGRIDRWEAYTPAGVLASVSFDTAGRGRPDRRIVYLPGGRTRLELDPEGTGFRPAPPAARR